MNHLRVIEGGRAPVPSDVGKMIEPPTDDLPERVQRAEMAAHQGAQLVAPGMAIIRNTRAELMRMVASVDLAEAVQTHAIFKEAVASVDALFEMLRAAEIRLAVAINAVARERLTEHDDD
jgi:hypothetical protein